VSQDNGQARVKVVFACPTLKRPYQQFLDAMRAEVPHLDAAGLDHKMVWEVGCPYISEARAKMLHRALHEADAEIVVFLDHDLSWKPGDLTKLVRTEGEVVAGLYRFKYPDVEYMGTVEAGRDRYPIVRESDGALKAVRVPAGFLKITRSAVQRFMRRYPELIYGDPVKPHIDLFNHGAHKGVWWGEDYAFSRRWRAMRREIWVVPDLDLTHHDHEAGDFPGNLHRFLLKPEPLKEAA
jgi:hypothetical protein